MLRGSVTLRLGVPVCAQFQCVLVWGFAISDAWLFFLFQILEFLKSRDDFVGTLLRHIGTSAIMDLLLRLLTCIESPEIRRAMVEVSYNA